IPEAFDWLTATNASGVVPDVITLEIAAPQPFTQTVQTTLLLVGGPEAGSPPQNLRLAPFNICPESVISLPSIFR
ncbi:MAG: hypothetical protein ACRC1H_09880, partial [Caldilineaceae bacterium]